MFTHRSLSWLLKTCALLTLAVAVALVANSHLAFTASLASFNVDNFADAVDANPGDGSCATSGGSCTLRAAIQEANALAGEDTVILPPGTYTLTITGRDEDTAATGDLDITANLIISGTGSGMTVIDGNGLDRVIHVPLSTTVVSISGITIQHGDAGISDGGGLYNLGTLHLADSAVISNTAVTSGTVRFYAGGGGIRNEGNMTVIACTVNGNTTGLIGGGISSGGALTLTNSIVAYNAGTSTGGVFNFGTMIISNTTVSDNVAELYTVGGIRNSGTMTLTNSTVTSNHDQQGMGGVTQDSSFPLMVKSTIIAYNYSFLSGTSDCMGSLTSLGHNLVGSSSSCFYQAMPTDQISVDPLLGPLANNGGPTLTRLPQSSSPAINKGDNVGCPATDQRGVSRPQAGMCDIGAVEVAFPYSVYLPLVRNNRPSSGIYGYVTDNGAPAVGVTLDLERLTGSTLTTVQTTTTQADGSFAFTMAPSLGSGQRYGVGYWGTVPTRLGYWTTKQIDTYTAGSIVHIGDFDIANVTLIAPSNGVSVTLPYTFQWTPRPIAPSDTYEFFMPGDNTNYGATPLGQFTLTTLPAGFAIGQSYYWGVYVYQPDGGYGISYEGRQVSFNNTGLKR
jgi:CSLREA domain-containing protein